mgnify:CR=1 FL=1
MLDQFVEIAQSELLKAHFALADLYFEVEWNESELEGAAVWLIGQVLSDLVNVFDRVNFFGDVANA